MTEIERAINIFEIDKHTSGNWTEVDELAIYALREQAERSKGCEWCNSEALDGVGLRKVFGTPKVYMCGGYGTPPKNEKFNYCPMCGRKLKEDNQ